MKSKKIQEELSQLAEQVEAEHFPTNAAMVDTAADCLQRHLKTMLNDEQMETLTPWFDMIWMASICETN
ncbi:hypothetical protein LCGC14_2028890 [marine sediment metagenome]|uniref:Uncharacterized protein n=1 Tax=marine sediment metagenome TaxID=412755 RepID=A0A0F9EV73_9ZZZZ